MKSFVRTRFSCGLVFERLKRVILHHLRDGTKELVLVNQLSQQSAAKVPQDTAHEIKVTTASTVTNFYMLTICQAQANMLNASSH